MTAFQWFLFGLFVVHPVKAEIIAERLPHRPQAEVSDYAGVLSAQSQKRLSQAFAEFNRTQKVQAACAIFPNLSGETIEDFTTKLFEQWNLGDRATDKGLLLVIAIQERAVRIEVGYGLEPIYTDAKAKRVIDQAIVPQLKNQNFEQATLAFLKASKQVLTNSSSAQAAKQDSPQTTSLRSWVRIFIFVLILIVLFFRRMFLRSPLRPRRKGGWHRGGGGGWWGGGGGSSSSGGFGGGGGFSGGGGSSGGGGASGRW